MFQTGIIIFSKHLFTECVSSFGFTFGGGGCFVYETNWAPIIAIIFISLAVNIYARKHFLK